MTRHNQSWRWILLGMLTALTGCHPTQPFYLHEDGDLSHFIDKATQQETPDVDQAPLAEVEQSHPPLTLSNPDYKEIWELSLEEVVSISLANTKLVRGGQPVRLQNGTLFAGTQEGNLLQLGSRSFASNSRRIAGSSRFDSICSTSSGMPSRLGKSPSVTAK